jgi:protein required for attachment to host cells
MWILIANATRAGCYRRDDASSLTPLHTFEHAESRSKGIELQSDRPGREDTKAGIASSPYQPRIGPKRKERDRFARELAHFVNEAVAGQRCEAWLLVAPNPFASSIRSHLTPEASRRLAGCIGKDLTALEGRQLSDRIAALEAPA